MIDQKVIENIKNYGSFRDSGEGRRKVLRDLGFKLDQKADYVLISGCLQPEALPQVFHALKMLFERLKINYTMLSKEYCCGWVPLGQPAVVSKNETDIAQVKELARGSIVQNYRQAEALGAKSIALFCAPCEPNYSNYREQTSTEVISYTELLNRHFNSGKLNLAIDYYAGCYRFRRRITEQPLDVEPAVRILSKITGLKVNYLDNKLCCYIPPHLEQLTASIKNRVVATICTGCYQSLRRKLGDKYEVKMLPEILVESL